MIDDIKFVHPKDMQDGKVEITDRDITTNLPYVDGVHLAFDHHLSETIRNTDKKDNYIIDPDSPSAARVVYNYFDGKNRFFRNWDSMMSAVDKADSADFTKEEILNPEGWVLLNFLMDPRTGLGRFRDFSISNYNLMMQLIEYCKDHSIDNIMKMPDVQERIELYNNHTEKFKEQIKSCSKVYNNLVVLDLRNEGIIYSGNRFMIYALFPECNISMHILWGLKKQNTVFAIGKSILNRTSKTNIGELMLRYDGGGHANAGTCQVFNDKTEIVMSELIKKINDNG
jgi:nanoRNase/pAp phosphatase (c-di-AMP/oligoRNAs hydrolase)